MRYKKNQKRMLLMVVLIFGVVSFVGSANAMSFATGSDTTIDCDVTVAYSAGMRVSDQDDDKIVGNLNGDDGNRNFDQWSMYNNKVTLLADIDIRHKNMGLFIRPKAFYDHVYKTDNDNDSPGTSNVAFSHPGIPGVLPPVSPIVSESDEWADEVESAAGANAEILDLYAYANFELADRFAELRVGRQVVSWGTSFLVSGGVSSAQSYADYVAATAPGVEVKEIYLPSEIVSFSWELADGLNFATYYQWMWHKTRLPEGGHFFSTSDMLDDIEAPILASVPGLGTIAALQRGDDRDPRRGGQYGVAFTYTPPFEMLNSTEFGLYYVNYHDKLPTVRTNAAIGRYWLEYTEDIQLYGVSFDTAIGDANVAGEFSYRDDLLIGGVDGNYWQAQVSALYGRGFKPICDRIMLMGEVGCGQTIGMPVDPFAWKYVLRFGFDYYQIIRDTDLTVTLIYSDQPVGTNPLGTEGAASGSIKLDFIYKQLYKAGIAYDDRFNSRRNSSSDRDTLSMYLSYTF